MANGGWPLPGPRWIQSVTEMTFYWGQINLQFFTVIYSYCMTVPGSEAELAAQAMCQADLWCSTIAVIQLSACAGAVVSKSSDCFTCAIAEEWQGKYWQGLACRQILHVLFLTIHHRYTYCCCPYVMNIVLLTCQDSKTELFVIF